MDFDRDLVRAEAEARRALEAYRVLCVRLMQMGDESPNIEDALRVVRGEAVALAPEDVEKVRRAQSIIRRGGAATLPPLGYVLEPVDDGMAMGVFESSMGAGTARFRVEDDSLEVGDAVRLAADGTVMKISPEDPLKDLLMIDLGQRGV